MKKQMDKNINAVKLVRKIRDQQYHEIKGKSPKDIIEYFKNKSRLLKKELEKIRKSQEVLA